MQKSDRIYLSKFALNPDTEYLDLENYDFGYDEDIDKFINTTCIDEEKEFLNRIKTVRRLWPYEN